MNGSVHQSHGPPSHLELSEAFRKAAPIYAIIWNKATLSESSSRLSTSSSVDLRQKWVYARDQIWAVFQKQMKTLAKRLSCCLQSLSSYRKIMSSPPAKTARPCPDCQIISLKEFWKPQLLPAGVLPIVKSKWTIIYFINTYGMVVLHNLSPKCTNLRKDFSIQLTPITDNNSSRQSD